jgi:hypothetical protein
VFQISVYIEPQTLDGGPYILQVVNEVSELRPTKPQTSRRCAWTLSPQPLNPKLKALNLSQVPVDRVVQVPVDRVVYKEVPVEIEKVVVKEVQVPVEITVEKVHFIPFPSLSPTELVPDILRYTIVEGANFSELDDHIVHNVLGCFAICGETLSYRRLNRKTYSRLLNASWR